MGIKEKFQELSLLDLSNRSDQELASLTTRHFSTERRGIMGDAPKTTKLIQSKLDRANDWITFYFLTESTEKYGPDYQYKDVDPTKYFRFNKNPSKTYEIHLRFYRISELLKLHTPPTPKSSKPPSEEISSGEELAFSKNIIPSAPIVSPSKEEPITQEPASTGEPKTALLNPIPSVDIEDEKSPEEDSSQLTSDGGNEMQEVPAGDPNPEEDIEEELLNKVTQQESTKIRESDLTVKAVKDWLWNTDMAIWSNSPSFHWQGFNYNLSQLHAAIYPTDIAPEKWDKVHGAALIDKHLFDLFIHIKFFLNQMSSSIIYKIRKNQESTKGDNSMDTIKEEGSKVYFNMLYSTSPNFKKMEYKDEWGKQIIFKEGKFSYQVEIEKNTDYLKEVIFSYDDHLDKFSYNIDIPLKLSERQYAFNQAKKCREFNIKLDSRYKKLSNKIYATLASSILSSLSTFLKVNENIVDILSTKVFFEKSIDTKLKLYLFEKLSYYFPEYYLEVATDRILNENILFLIHQRNYNNLFKSYLQEEQENKNIKKTLVCTFGNYCPPTKVHVDFLNKIVQTAQSKNGSNIVFILSVPSFEQDEISAKLKADILSKEVPGLNVCVNEGIETILDAMIWAYNHSYKEIILIVGDDQQLEYEGILAENNDNITSYGYFKFDDYKVVSIGLDNPDKSKEALQARKALENGDFKSFVASTGLQSSSNIKDLYTVLSYELSANLGLDESIILREMGPTDLKQFLSSEDNWRKLQRMLRQGGHPVIIGRGTDDQGRPLAFSRGKILPYDVPNPQAGMIQRLVPMYRELIKEGNEVPASLFEMLFRYWYPKETRDLEEGFFLTYAKNWEMELSELPAV